MHARTLPMQHALLTGKEEGVTSSAKSDPEVLSATEPKPDSGKESNTGTTSVTESSEAAVAADSAGADAGADNGTTTSDRGVTHICMTTSMPKL